MQELKAPDTLFPAQALLGFGYNTIWQGQKSWNGVAIRSKYEIKETRLGLGAEFTKAYADFTGKLIQPAEYAVHLVQKEDERNVAVEPKKGQEKLRQNIKSDKNNV